MSWARTAIFTIVIMAMMFNMSKGIMNEAFPQFEAGGYTSGLNYQSGYESTFIGGMNKTLSPEADAISSTNGLGFIGFMNKLNLGFMVSMYTHIDTYMFGLINDMETVIGPFMGDNPGLRTMLFGSLKSILMLLYIMGVWMLLTGRDILGD